MLIVFVWNVNQHKKPAMDLLILVIVTERADRQKQTSLKHPFAEVFISLALVKITGNRTPLALERR